MKTKKTGTSYEIKMAYATGARDAREHWRLIPSGVRMRMKVDLLPEDLEKIFPDQASWDAAQRRVALFRTVRDDKKSRESAALREVITKMSNSGPMTRAEIEEFGVGRWGACSGAFRNTNEYRGRFATYTVCPSGSQWRWAGLWTEAQEFDNEH